MNPRAFLNIQLPFLILFLSFAVAGNGQNVKTPNTDLPVNIPGTRVYLLAPPSYSMAENFVGLKKGKTVVLNIFDHPGKNFYSEEINFGPDKYPKGAKMLESKDCKIGNFQAKLALVQNDSKVNSLGIIFGDSTFAAMLMGIYFITDTQAETELRQIFQTVSYDKNLRIDPFATAIFTVDDSRSPFKLLRNNEGTFVYTLNAKPRKQNGEDPFITIRSVPLDSNMNAKGLAEFYLHDLEKYGLSETTVKQAGRLTINGLESYEQQVQGLIKEKKYFIYELAITKNKKAIIIEGSVRAESATQLDDIKQLGKTVKFK